MVNFAAKHRSRLQVAPVFAASLQGRNLASWTKILVVGAGALFVSQYLAGYGMLVWLHLDPEAVTPLTIWRYVYHYADVPPIRQRFFWCQTVAIVLVLAMVSIPWWPRRRALHGEARFARRHEIYKAGLFSDQGVILGAVRRRLLMLPGQQSIILAAPPRSGKGVGVVVPNALNWSGSLVAIDIKRENWTITAGFRAAAGQRCFLFEPLAEDGRTARWNCLSYVATQPDQRINDLQRIADIIYLESPGADPFWVASARSLFLGIALYLFETPSLPATMGEIRRQGMATDDEGFGAHWKRIVEGRRDGAKPLSEECVRALYDVIDLAPVTASSVRKTFTSRLDLWANPLLDRATSADDFDLRDLRKVPMSIYVAVNPDDLHRLRPVLSLFFQQCLGLQTRELPEHNPALKYQLLMLLDEFTALGRIPIISESIAFLPGFNVRVVLVIQAASQLREVYGPHAAETMLKSVAARIVFAPKDFADAKEISNDLGFTTVKVHSQSLPRFSLFKRDRGGSVSIAEQARALMLPQEVKEMGSEVCLVFLEGVRPIRAQKIRYFKDRRFASRVLPPPVRPAPAGKRKPPARAAEVLVMPKRPRSLTSLSAQELMEILDEITIKDLPKDLQELATPRERAPTEEEMTEDLNRFGGALWGDSHG